MKISSIDSLDVHITSPMKAEMIHLKMNSIVLMTGMNNTGKSWYLANFWALSYLAQAILTAKKMSIPLSNIECAQFVYDHCFDNRIDGRVQANFNKGTLSVLFTEGKVTDVIIEDFEDITECAMARYLSSQMRTFDSIKIYLRIRKMCGKSGQELIGEMIKSYKLYDVMYLEQLINAMPITVDEKMKETLLKFEITDSIILFNVSLENCDFYAAIADENFSRIKYLTTYSAGHQSLLNMFMSNLL